MPNNPFQELNRLCGAYATAFEEFNLVQTAILQRQRLEVGEITPDEYQAAAVLAQGRISLLTPLNDLITVELPITPALLRPACDVLANRLSGLVDEIHVQARDAAATLAEKKGKAACPTPKTPVPPPTTPS